MSEEERGRTSADQPRAVGASAAGRATLTRRPLGCGDAAASAAVVAFRVGRVPAYRQAFAVPAGAALRAGEEVWVRPRRCELEAVRADRATR